MTELVLGIDPGKATGWSTWFLDPDVPIQRAEYGVIHGGVDGWITWAETRLAPMRPDVIVFEVFELDGRTMNPPLVAKEIEGSLKTIVSALALPTPFWQGNDMKALCSDDTLRRGGLWLMPKDVDHTDARDVNDSQIHVLAWAKVQEEEYDFQPTTSLYWPERDMA